MGPLRPDAEDQVDLSPSLHPPGVQHPGTPSPPTLPAPIGRPYLRLYFRCSNQYTRVYRNPEGTSYLGRCPACGKTIRFVVGPGGSSERSFIVSC
jgi:hypothetical protein